MLCITPSMVSGVKHAYKSRVSHFSVRTVLYERLVQEAVIARRFRGEITASRRQIVKNWTYSYSRNRSTVKLKLLTPTRHLKPIYYDT